MSTSQRPDFKQKTDMTPDGSKDYFATLKLTPQHFRGKSEEEIEGMLNEQFDKLKKELDKDKDKDKEKEDDEEEDIVKQIIEAILMLIDRDKREQYMKLRQKHIEDEKNKTEVAFFPENSNQDEVSKKPDGTKLTSGKSFQSLVPLKELETEFNEFAKKKLPGMTDQDLEKNGYSARYENSASGQQVLVLTFPDKESAQEFIDKMLDKKLITGVDQQKQSTFNPTPLPTTLEKK